MYLVSPEPVALPVQGCKRSGRGSTSRPSRWHPQHMWHDLLQHWCTRAPSHCANSRQGPQMWVAPLGQGSRMRCPSLCVALQMLLATARLSASLGLDQIHTEECSLRLSLQPPCNAGAHTHTHSQTKSHLESFLKGANFIRGKM